jgi:hypothetical protein
MDESLDVSGKGFTNEQPKVTGYRWMDTPILSWLSA